MAGGNWLSITKFLVVLATGTLLVSCTVPGFTSSPNSPVEALRILEECRQADPDPDSPARVLVWIEVGRGAQVQGPIAAHLDSLPVVEGYRYVDSDETWQRVLETYADEPAVIELVDKSTLPTSFEVDIGSVVSAEYAAEELRVIEGVDSVEVESRTEECSAEFDGLEQACRTSGPIELIIFLHPDATEAANSEVVRVLESLHLIESFQYVDKQETYDEFADYYDDEPEITELVDLQKLPTSFTALLLSESDRAEVQALREELESINSVMAASLKGPCIPIVE